MGHLAIDKKVLVKKCLSLFDDVESDLDKLEELVDKENPEYKFTSFYGAESIDHKFFGEDHCFAKRLRDMGIPMWIYPNVNIVHWGYKDFGGNYDMWLKKNFNEDKSKVVKHLQESNKEGQRLAM